MVQGLVSATPRVGGGLGCCDRQTATASAGGQCPQRGQKRTSSMASVRSARGHKQKFAAKRADCRKERPCDMQGRPLDRKKAFSRFTRGSIAFAGNCLPE